jgi:glycosyltransferase involved in cell wall biosynthesis
MVVILDSGDPMKLSIIIPCFNEQDRLSRTIDQIRNSDLDDTEVILVDDGSTDGTSAIIQSAVELGVLFKAVFLPVNKGKGAAIRSGIAHSIGDSIVFMDADLATDLSGLDEMVNRLAENDVVIGSRAVAGSELLDENTLRQLMGGLFNLLTRKLTGLPFRDTQCGFKGFRREIAILLFGALTTERFAFDAELLSIAHRSGLKIVEMPVIWTNVAGSRVRKVRDSLQMTKDMRRFAKSGSQLTDSLAVICFEDSAKILVTEILDSTSNAVVNTDVETGVVRIFLPNINYQTPSEIIKKLEHSWPNREQSGFSIRFADQDFVISLLGALAR